VKKKLHDAREKGMKKYLEIDRKKYKSE